MITADEAKAMSRRLRSALAARGYTVSHCEALELIANQLGHRDWNTASVILPAKAPHRAFEDGARVSTVPKVVSTSPAQRQVADAGSLVLSVTFDRPMLPGSFSFCRTSPETYPETIGGPVLSSDGRTYSLRCNVQPCRQYEVWFNRPPSMNFRALDGTSAEPYQLTFST
jgi:hypothetical protein